MPRMAVNHKEAGARSAAPEKYAGYEVRDPTGRKFGTVEKVFASEDGEPQYIRVKIGLFGSKTVLLPVNSVAVDNALRDLTLE